MDVAIISNQRRRLRVIGVDRANFLHGQCTNDIKRLHAGESCYAAFLNARGKMRGEGHIICLQDAFLLEVNEDLPPSLAKFIITEDVMIEDVSDLLACYLIIRREGHAPSWPKTAGEADAMLRGSGQAPRIPPGFDLPAEAVTFAHPLGIGVLSSASLPVTLDAPTLDALRIEAGIPAWGVDMDENTIPVEVGLAGRAISYDKGCYIGQETIARIKTYGHVNRRLVQLSVVSDQSSGRGEEILSADREIGVVTSAARSNRLGKPLALGYVRSEFAVVGNKLTIGRQPAEVLKICGQ